jgi:hypothetical protein
MTNTHGFSRLQVAGPTTATADRAALDATHLRDGFTLPPSYREFAERFGYGLLCNLFIVYIPMGKHGDSLPVREKELTAMLRESMEEELFEYEPDGSPELVERLIPFGISENGHTLTWDAASRTPDGEYPIYVIGAKTLDVRRAAPDLSTFVEQCLDARVKSMIGPGYEPLPPTFKPLKPSR